MLEGSDTSPRRNPFATAIGAGLSVVKLKKSTPTVSAVSAPPAHPAVVVAALPAAAPAPAPARKGPRTTEERGGVFVDPREARVAALQAGAVTQISVDEMLKKRAGVMPKKAAQPTASAKKAIPRTVWDKKTLKYVANPALPREEYDELKKNMAKAEFELYEAEKKKRLEEMARQRARTQGNPTLRINKLLGEITDRAMHLRALRFLGNLPDMPDERLVPILTQLEDNKFNITPIIEKLSQELALPASPAVVVSDSPAQPAASAPTPDQVAPAPARLAMSAGLLSGIRRSGKQGSGDASVTASAPAPVLAPAPAPAPARPAMPVGLLSGIRGRGKDSTTQTRSEVRSVVIPARVEAVQTQAEHVEGVVVKSSALQSPLLQAVRERKLNRYSEREDVEASPSSAPYTPSPELPPSSSPAAPSPELPQAVVEVPAPAPAPAKSVENIQVNAFADSHTQRRYDIGLSIMLLTGSIEDVMANLAKPEIVSQISPRILSSYFNDVQKASAPGEPPNKQESIKGKGVNNFSKIVKSGNAKHVELALKHGANSLTEPSLAFARKTYEKELRVRLEAAHEGQKMREAAAHGAQSEVLPADKVVGIRR